ncbi:rhodanese-like domain-containing protein [Paenibacillus sp. OV219]|uniref:rhodanese-like domain-containing protein n=1 Tax=Paenibacillus sp. OV219 TaxID=1884377 RepID=UPI0008AAB8E5|nr:rhodanese-like domain-containing protein [Paenibacillus sp. OV219]SEN54026.1 Rhodanese-related sulfurtransferase [Paenibacillus sp. OV219]
MAFQVARELSPQQLAAQLSQGEQPFMLDVRELNEWAAGHLAGAVHIPVGQLLERLNELPAGRELVVMCKAGGRSGLACELLSERGYDVINLTGGLMSWTGELVQD